MLKFRIFILTLCMIFITTSAQAAGAFKADARTKRIPAGTIFQLEFLQPVTTFSGSEGDSFSAILKNEQSTKDNIILPLGSVIRGSVLKVNVFFLLTNEVAVFWASELAVLFAPCFSLSKIDIIDTYHIIFYC